jgi:hypothetical protein
MFLASKAAWAGIVHITDDILLTAGVSGPRPTPLPLGANLSKEVPAVGDSERCQEDAANSAGQRTLRGEVDGVFGLRTEF